MKQDRKIRVLAAKPGLDGHDRGIKVICAALRDAGMDVIAMSCLSGAHGYLFPRVMDILRGKGVSDILVLGGGIIPEEDVPALKGAGIAEIFTPGTDTGDIAAYIRENIRKN